MIYDAIIWLAIVAGLIEFVASGSLPAGGLALLLAVVQIVRVLRHRRMMAF